MVYLYNRDARPKGVSGFFRVRPVFCAAGVFCFFRCLLSTVYCLLSSFVWGWFCGAVFWLCGVFFCFFGVRGGCLPADVSEVLFSCIYNFCEFCSFCELFRQLLIGFSLYGLKFIIAEQKRSIVCDYAAVIGHVPPRMEKCKC